MTISQLLELPTEEYESFSDEKLLELYGPLLEYSKPLVVVEEKEPKPPKEPKAPKLPKDEAKKAKAKARSLESQKQTLLDTLKLLKANGLSTDDFIQNLPPELKLHADLLKQESLKL